jgi:hypothetical protein
LLESRDISAGIAAMSTIEPGTQGRTFLAGKLIFNFGGSAIDCIVRRRSDEGATVELASALGVPEHFQLLIPSENQQRMQARVAVGQAAGIEV